jgi:hypothetical protein
VVTLELGIEDSGAIPIVVLGGNAHHVRDKEDVPHEGSLPDLYGLGRGFTLSEFVCAVEGEHILRARLLDMVKRSTEIRVEEDDETFGLLLWRTRAYPKGEPRNAVEYVDLIISDVMGADGHARVRALEADLVEVEGMVSVEMFSANRPNDLIEGSNSFKIVRYCKAVLA